MFPSQLTMLEGSVSVREHGAGGDRILQEKGRDDEFRVSIQPVPALLGVTPDITWQDVVYYNSYTTYVGWKKPIVDNFRRSRRPGFRSS